MGAQESPDMPESVRALTGPTASAFAWIGDRSSDLVEHACRVQFSSAGFDTAKFAEGPMILSANHRSLLDTAAIRHALPAVIRARTATVGARDFFSPSDADRGVKRWLRSALCSYVVRTYRVCLIGRGDDMGDGVDRITGLLQSGWNVILFPEGTRARSASLGRFRTGVAHIARATHARVLPIWIEGSDRLLPVGGKFINAGAVHVNAGSPMRIGADESNHEFLARMRREIEALRVR
jgi:1-acyl-sn-glycerol-3-phosphate acyltransferase